MDDLEYKLVPITPTIKMADVAEETLKRLSSGRPSSWANLAIHAYRAMIAVAPSNHDDQYSVLLEALDKIATGHITGEPAHTANTSRVKSQIAAEALLRARLLKAHGDEQ